MKINVDTFNLMLTFGIAMIGVLLLIFVIAVIVPKLSKWIDRAFGIKSTPPPEVSPEDYTVQDIYEGD
ncbi:MAG: hypothetical protein LBL87_00790 [Ruminococcus sp.]|jgi:hypothetical protein|nr:hypothetical protein [Ruminococcus sp.]